MMMIDEIEREADAAYGTQLKLAYVEQQARRAREAYGAVYNRPHEPEAPVPAQAAPRQVMSTEPYFGEPRRPKGSPPPQWSARQGRWLPRHIFLRANEREIAARIRAAQGLDPRDEAATPVDLSAPLPRVRSY
jgi:hypothetical protein